MVLVLVFQAIALVTSYETNYTFYKQIMLVLVLIVQLTALISSYKTYKRFKRDMSRGGVDPEPKAGIFTRIRYN